MNHTHSSITTVRANASHTLNLRCGYDTRTRSQNKAGTGRRPLALWLCSPIPIALVGVMISALLYPGGFETTFRSLRNISDSVKTDGPMNI